MKIGINKISLIRYLKSKIFGRCCPGCGTKWDENSGGFFCRECVQQIHYQYFSEQNRIEDMKILKKYYYGKLESKPPFKDSI